MAVSTLQFDDVGVVPDLLPGVQRSCMRLKKRSRRRPGNEAKVELLNVSAWSGGLV